MASRRLQMTDRDSLSERGRALEDEYFHRKSRELIETMRLATTAEQVRGEMERTSGLDPVLLKELQTLGFTADTVVLLPVMPVLEMAWVEGEIIWSERDLLVKFARSRGIDQHSAADEQLTRWMTTRPDHAVFLGARRLLAAGLASDSIQAGGRLSADDLVAYCKEIAAASGGILGLRIGSISSEERVLLSRLASDLDSATGVTPAASTP